MEKEKKVVKKEPTNSNSKEFKKGFFSFLGKGTAFLIILARARMLGLLNFRTTSHKEWYNGYIYKDTTIKKD